MFPPDHLTIGGLFQEPALIEYTGVEDIFIFLLWRAKIEGKTKPWTFNIKLGYSTYKIDTVVLAEIENICKINFGYMDEDSTKLINYI